MAHLYNLSIEFECPSISFLIGVKEGNLYYLFLVDFEVVNPKKILG